MKRKLVLASLMFSTLSLSATAYAGNVQDAIEAARKAQKAASAVGFEWRDMGKMIKKAEAAAKKGDKKKAIKIANTVVAQGKAALKQAEVAKTAGPHF